MRTGRKWLLVWLCLWEVVGCGGDGTSAGEVVAKSGSGGSKSSAIDSSSGVSGDRSSGSATGGSSGSSSGDAARTSSTGGSSNMGSTGGSSSAANLPSDGNQLSVCAMQAGECNKGYACTLGEGPNARGFCSKLCDVDADCDGLAPSGTKYVCGMGAGAHVCTIPCQDAMDTSTCPAGMVCQPMGPGATPHGDMMMGGPKMGDDMMMPAGRGDMLGTAGHGPIDGTAGAAPPGVAGAGAAGAPPPPPAPNTDGGMPMPMNASAHCRYPADTSSMP